MLRTASTTSTTSDSTTNGVISDGENSGYEIWLAGRRICIGEHRKLLNRFLNPSNFEFLETPNNTSDSTDSTSTSSDSSTTITTNTTNITNTNTTEHTLNDLLKTLEKSLPLSLHLSNTLSTKSRNKMDIQKEAFLERIEYLNTFLSDSCYNYPLLLRFTITTSTSNTDTSSDSNDSTSDSSSTSDKILHTFEYIMNTKDKEGYIQEFHQLPFSLPLLNYTGTTTTSTDTDSGNMELRLRVINETYGIDQIVPIYILSPLITPPTATPVTTPVTPVTTTPTTPTHTTDSVIRNSDSDNSDIWVISDIDDTIKITNITYPLNLVTEGFFFKPFQNVYGMLSLFRYWDDGDLRWLKKYISSSGSSKKGDEGGDSVVPLKIGINTTEIGHIPTSSSTSSSTTENNDRRTNKVKFLYLSGVPWLFSNAYLDQFLEYFPSGPFFPRMTLDLPAFPYPLPSPPSTSTATTGVSDWIRMNPTYWHKMNILTTLLTPSTNSTSTTTNRKIFLLGDTGEKDPEIYADFLTYYTGGFYDPSSSGIDSSSTAEGEGVGKGGVVCVMIRVLDVYNETTSSTISTTTEKSESSSGSDGSGDKGGDSGSSKSDDLNWMSFIKNGIIRVLTSFTIPFTSPPSTTPTPSTTSTSNTILHHNQYPHTSNYFGFMNETIPSKYIKIDSPIMTHHRNRLYHLYSGLYGFEKHVRLFRDGLDLLDFDLKRMKNCFDKE